MRASVYFCTACALVACGRETDGSFVALDATDDAVIDAPGMPPSAVKHDEDLDGIVDAFDNCPNVANRDQAGPSGPLGVGEACRFLPRSSRTWAARARRVFFDPLVVRSDDWTWPTLFSLGADGDSLHAQSSSAIDVWTTNDPGPPVGDGDAIVVTAVVP